MKIANTRMAFAMVLLGSATAIQTAQAAGAGVRAGLDLEGDDPLVGAELITPMSARWFFNPNVEHVFSDGADETSLNADFHYDIGTGESTYVWLGGGPALRLRDTGGDDDADVAVNALMGVGWRTAGGAIPYVQAKAILADDTGGALVFGIRF